METIILDLDKTLIHSIKAPDEQTFDKRQSCGDNGVLLDSGYITFKRPNSDRFVRWCFRRYKKVVLWSAGTSSYVHEILKKMFSEFSFHLVLTRDHCALKRRKDFNQPTVRTLLRQNGINIHSLNKGEGVYFVDDKLYRIQNNCNVKLIEIKPFESKWIDWIWAGKKRKRPIRENDSTLLNIRRRLTLK